MVGKITSIFVVSFEKRHAIGRGPHVGDSLALKSMSICITVMRGLSLHANISHPWGCLSKGELGTGLLDLFHPNFLQDGFTTCPFTIYHTEVSLYLDCV